MFETDSAYHRLKVTDNEGVRLLQFERNRQSSMRLDDPFETDFEYPGYLHITYAIAPHALDTLIIGLGGGMVVKRMWRDYAPMRVDVVELDPEVVAIARAYFALPSDPRIRVFVDDGRRFVDNCDESYDIVILDAFDDDSIPRPLLTEECMRSVAALLNPGGVVAWNIIGAVYGGQSKLFRSVYRTARNVWRNVWVFPVGFADDVTDRTRNIIMLASDVDLSEDELCDRIADRVGGRVTVPKFDRLCEDLYQGRVRSGDVGMLLDERRRRR